MSVRPSGLRASGLWPVFSSRKKWIIKCGKCGFNWSDRVIVDEPSMSICPACRTINEWSIYEFQKLYDKETGGINETLYS